MSVRAGPRSGDYGQTDEAYDLVLDNSDFAIRDLTAKQTDPPQEPEVLVDIWEGDDTFVRIPVTETELWVNKDGPADINRTAKVTFPAEWGGVDITQFVHGYTNEDDEPYDMARIWFYDSDVQNYQIAHFGYVGGVGPASESGTFKFWVYDPADLMKRIPVSKSLADPSIQQMLDLALRGTDNVGDPIGLENRTVFGKVAPLDTYIAGVQEVLIQKADQTSFGTDVDVVDGGADINVGPLSAQFSDLIDDVFDLGFGTDITGGAFGGQKSFKRNRHNMADLLNWFADRVGGKWHFEPSPSGPILWYDNRSQEYGNDQLVRRTFVEWELTEPIGPSNQDEVEGAAPNRRVVDEFDDVTEQPLFAPVKTLDNEALRDMKPFNTLRLYGESSSATPYTSDAFRDAASSSAIAEAFPYIQVTYEPLLDRAGGHRMMKEVESSEKDLATAREVAIKQFRTELEEETEGTMTLLGEPYVLPYDYIVSIAVCNETYPNVEQQPIRYEVNSVKHTRSAGERYKTELGVSIDLQLTGDQLDVDAEYKPA